MMAAPPDPAQSRKKVSTYGKSRKRLPGLTQVSPQKITNYTGDFSSREASSLDSTPRLSPERPPPSVDLSRVPTLKRPRSADVFDVPSSDEDDMPSQSMNPKRATNIQSGIVMKKKDGQRKDNLVVDAKRRKIEPMTATINTKESRPTPKKQTLSRPVALGDGRSRSSPYAKPKPKGLSSSSLLNRAEVGPNQSSNSQSISISTPVSVPVRKRLASPKPKDQVNNGLFHLQRPKLATKPSLQATNERRNPASQPNDTRPSISKPSSSQDINRPKASRVVPMAKNEKPPILRHNTAPISATAKALLKPESSIYDIDDSSADEAVKPRRAAPIMKAKKTTVFPSKPAFVSHKEKPPAKTESKVWDIDESSADELEKIPTPPGRQNFTIPVLEPEPRPLPAQSPAKYGGSRRRLIDSFAEPFAKSFEASSSSSSESEDESIETPQASQIESQKPMIHQSHSFDEQNGMERVEAPNTGIGEPSGSQTRRPRMTYGSSRSMLADQAMDFNTPMFTDLEMDDASKRRARRAIVPTTKPLQNSLDDSDGLDESQGKADIRSLHELKQAGAKSRIVTNVEHLLADIGVPGKAAISQRRSGLLDLSTRLLDKDFRREFLDTGLETGLFLHLGMEEDVVAGSMLVSSLLVCLHDTFGPHTVQQLRQQGLARLLIRQIDKTLSIQAIAKERTSNMSKIAQQLLAEYQASLLQADIWEDTKPQVITPRAIALRCLELTVRKTREAGISTVVMSKELSSKLFSILQSFNGDVTNNANTDARFVEFQLVLSTLNSHSVRAMTNRDEEIWITDYLPTIANVLQRVLADTQTEFGPTQVLALGLTINVTNNNPKACSCFANKDLLRAIGSAIVKNFNLLSGFLIEEERLKVVDNVIMTLGVLINFAEWDETSRLHLQSFMGTQDDPLEQFIRIFLENKAKTAEANSIEETHQNVAFGYLAVLLGYLSISAPILRRVQQAQTNRSLRPLIASIEEFISYWKQVDEMARGDDDGQEPTQGLVPRLQRMVDQLREMSGSPLRV